MCAIHGVCVCAYDIRMAFSCTVYVQLYKIGLFVGQKETQKKNDFFLCFSVSLSLSLARAIPVAGYGWLSSLSYGVSAECILMIEWSVCDVHVHARPLVCVVCVLSSLFLLYAHFVVYVKMRV